MAMLAVEGSRLHPDVVALAAAANYAAVSTLLPDGHPQTQLTWVDTDGVHLLVNTPTGTQKYRNVRRDPRITVTIWNRDDPFQYAEVRGRVVRAITGEVAWEHINALAQKYLGARYRGPDSRVLLAIEAGRQLFSRPPRQ
jgi:PPOX class probable F420-dependent enzyme